MTSVPQQRSPTIPRLAQSVYGSADERAVSMSGRLPLGEDVVSEVITSPSLDDMKSVPLPTVPQGFIDASDSQVENPYLRNGSRCIYL